MVNGKIGPECMGKKYLFQSCCITNMERMVANNKVTPKYIMQFRGKN